MYRGFLDHFGVEPGINRTIDSVTVTKVWVSGEPGLNNEAFVYLVSKNPMAIGTDTWGVDVVPPAKGDEVFYGHVTTLVQNDVYKCADLGSILILSSPFRSICVEPGSVI